VDTPASASRPCYDHRLAISGGAGSCSRGHADLMRRTMAVRLAGLVSTRWLATLTPYGTAPIRHASKCGMPRWIHQRWAAGRLQRFSPSCAVVRESCFVTEIAVLALRRRLPDSAPWFSPGFGQRRLRSGSDDGGLFAGRNRLCWGRSGCGMSWPCIAGARCVTIEGCSCFGNGSHFAEPGGDAGVPTRRSGASGCES